MKKDRYVSKDLKIMWRVYKLINKEHCQNKLKIDKIYLRKKNKCKKFGYYEPNENNRIIMVCSELDLLYKLRVFIHELSHAYLEQIAKRGNLEDYRKIVDGQHIHRKDKNEIWYMLIHNKKFKKVMDLFLDTLSKNLKKVL